MRHRFRFKGLYEHGNEMYSLVQLGPDDFETVKVKIGATNDTMASIDEGLSEGDKVVLNLREHLSLMDLPDVVREDNSEMRKLGATRTPRPGAPDGAVGLDAGPDGPERGDLAVLAAGVVKAGPVAAVAKAAADQVVDAGRRTARWTWRSGAADQGGGAGNAADLVVVEANAAADLAAAVECLMSTQWFREAWNEAIPTVTESCRRKKLERWIRSSVQMVTAADTDGDGSVSRAELTASIKKRISEGGGR